MNITSDTKNIETLKANVKIVYGSESSGHDWWHVYRVYKMARELAELECADVELVAAAALVHDIGDYKLMPDGIERHHQLIPPILLECGYNIDFVRRVLLIVDNVSFKGEMNRNPVSDVETACVQDADRLDAMGAIGIARAFAYGGKKGRSIYVPGENPKRYEDFKEYQTNASNTVNHFYEKLLLLKDRMNTNSGKSEAEKRHKFMLDFLNHFYQEWEGDL